jgi:hypothetical protein
MTGDGHENFPLSLKKLCKQVRLQNVCGRTSWERSWRLLASFSQRTTKKKPTKKDPERPFSARPWPVASRINEVVCASSGVFLADIS